MRKFNLKKLSLLINCFAFIACLQPGYCSLEDLGDDSIESLVESEPVEIEGFEFKAVSDSDGKPILDVGKSQKGSFDKDSED